jgi:phosphoribosylformylglycinamidine (FGAM) synthase-like amidotransferase family enzyme
VDLLVERADTSFTSRSEPGRRLTIPVKHGEGCYFADGPLLARLEANRQIALRYEDNPNGSIGDIAAVTNEAGNVFGLMPHPEHAVDPQLGSTDGADILGSLVDAARECVPVPA